MLLAAVASGRLQDLQQLLVPPPPTFLDRIAYCFTMSPEAQNQQLFLKAVPETGGRSPLEVVVRQGHVEMVQWLLNDSPIHEQLREQFELLTEAAYSNNPNRQAEVMQVLAEVAEEELEQMQYLDAYNSRLGQVDALLSWLLNESPVRDELRRKLDQRTLWARKLLSVVAEAGQTEVMQVLLQVQQIQKQFLHAVDVSDASPLNVAAREGQVPMLRFLLHQSVIREQLRSSLVKRETLQTAMAYGHLEAMEMLMQLKEVQQYLENVQNEVSFARSPLYVAANKCQPEAFKLLMTNISAAQKAAVTKVDPWSKHTLLTLAAERNCLSILEQMLEMANVLTAEYLNHADELGMTALGHAVYNKNIQAVKLLAKAGLPKLLEDMRATHAITKVFSGWGPVSMDGRPRDGPLTWAEKKEAREDREEIDKEIAQLLRTAQTQAEAEGAGRLACP